MKQKYPKRGYRIKPTNNNKSPHHQKIPKVVRRALSFPEGGTATLSKSVDNLDNLVAFASRSFISPFTVFSGLRPTQ